MGQQTTEIQACQGRCVAVLDKGNVDEIEEWIEASSVPFDVREHLVDVERIVPLERKERRGTRNVELQDSRSGSPFDA